MLATKLSASPGVQVCTICGGRGGPTSGGPGLTGLACMQPRHDAAVMIAASKKVLRIIEFLSRGMSGPLVFRCRSQRNQHDQLCEVFSTQSSDFWPYGSNGGGGP